MLKVKCSSCNKRAFPSRDLAIKFMKYTDCVDVYRCRHTGTWHMTSHPIKPVIRKTRNGWMVKKMSGKASFTPDFAGAVKIAGKENRRVLTDPALRIAVAKRLLQNDMRDQAIKLIGM